MQECPTCRGTGNARPDRRLRPRAMPLDPATLHSVIAQVERQLQQPGSCALCQSADLIQHLGWLRGLLTIHPA